jgi:hypothetical protein
MQLEQKLIFLLVLLDLCIPKLVVVELDSVID